jgi:hypothetical protein
MAFYLRGFTVDDALIPARYATHVARGLGYRFNAHGPSTDGVTPLGWAYVLAPFAAGGPLEALAAARAIGAIAWIGAAAALGRAVQSISGSAWRYAALVLVLCSAPLGAWAWSGLETGVVVALATMAAVLPARSSYSLGGAVVAGACAGLRPEMIAYACVLGGGRAALASSPRRKGLALGLALAPWCVAAGVRWIVWGRPAPLAVLAKPSDLAHGATYVLLSIVLAGAPFAALAPFAWRKLPTWPRVLMGAALAHLVVVALAGGDWMPLARLICPVVPALVLVTAHLLAEPSGAVFAKIRLAIGCAGQAYVLAKRGPVAAHVLRDRIALIDAARPVLAGATRVATIDVGWVGAATDADVVDLAGATDPEVAALAGGHTSKAVSAAFLTGRNPDRLVFEVRPGAASSEEQTGTHLSEARLMSDPLVRRTYQLVWRSPETLPIRYVIWSRTDAASPPSDPPRGD